MVRQPDILERIIEPQHGGFSEEHARYVLSLDFTSDEHARYAELASKAQEGSLSEDEQSEIDEFLAVNALLTVLQSKARVSLKKHNSAA
ncbi:MAG: hypothetical protein ABSH08_06570 [Tepidisphaeraceae bacterium]|jgi:hypothetical protein